MFCLYASKFAFTGPGLLRYLKETRGMIRAEGELCNSQHSDEAGCCQLPYFNEVSFDFSSFGKTFD